MRWQQTEWDVLCFCTYPSLFGGHWNHTDVAAVLLHFVYDISITDIERMYHAHQNPSNHAVNHGSRILCFTTFLSLYAG